MDCTAPICWSKHATNFAFFYFKRDFISFYIIVRCAQEHAFMLVEEKLNYLLAESKKEKKNPKTFALNRNLLHALGNYFLGKSTRHLLYCNCFEMHI